jgi:uncharacterized Zn finger protein
MFTLTEDDIRRYADAQSYERGLQYFRSGAVQSVDRLGDVMVAEVEGSGPEPYNVTLEAGGKGKVHATCDCPYDWGGWCKHIVAVAIALVRRPELTSAPSSLESALAPLDRDALQKLVIELAVGDAGFRTAIEAAADRLAARAHPLPSQYVPETIR